MSSEYTTKIALILILLFSLVVLWATLILGDGEIDLKSDTRTPAIQQSTERQREE